jgi:hypothetical protein
LQTSGPVFCTNGAGFTGATQICPDDCNDPSLAYPKPSLVDWKSKNGTRGPGAGKCGLAWVQATLGWARTQRRADGEPALKAVMLGDELSGNMDLGNFSRVADAIHDYLRGTEHFVYTNEGTHAYGAFGWKYVPAGIDVISVDGYGICTEEEAVHEWCAGVNASEAQWHRNSYEQLLYPKLMPHQRVAVIPGLLGCSTPEQAGGCEEDVTISGRCFCFVSGTDLSPAGLPAGQSKWRLRKLGRAFGGARRAYGYLPSPLLTSFRR